MIMRIVSYENAGHYTPGVFVVFGLADQASINIGLSKFSQIA